MALKKPMVLVHDILGTPVRMGVAPVLHSAQRTLDEILGGRWLDSQGGAGAGGCGIAPKSTSYEGAKIEKTIWKINLFRCGYAREFSQVLQTNEHRYFFSRN